MSQNDEKFANLSRRSLLQAGAGLAGGVALPSAFGLPAFAVGAADKPAIGTWPAGSEGDTVNVAAAVPRTGTYAVQGEDELKGWQLAVDHINSGDALLKKIHEHNLPEESFRWYLDLRKYGSVPHSGFGLGVERTVAWIAGTEHIRECIPFPRMLYKIYP